MQTVRWRQQTEGSLRALGEDTPASVLLCTCTEQHGRQKVSHGYTCRVAEGRGERGGPKSGSEKDEL